MADGAVAFSNPTHLAFAQRAAESVWRRLWNGERLARLWADDMPREDGALQDYAWLGLAFVALGDATGSALWQDRATTLAQAMITQFEDGSGRLKMAAADGPLGPIYDSTDDATPSGESSALKLLALLARRQASTGFEVHALSLRGALSGPLASQPLLRPDALTASRTLDLGESGKRQAFAKGTVFAHLFFDRISLRIAPGWHVNAHEPGQDWLIGASMKGAAVQWPTGIPLRTGFSEQVIQVYEGTIEVPLTAIKKDTLEMTLQVCSDEICLAPETAIFRLP